MQIHKLELAEDYNLIGIHTAEEDYRLAYLLNVHLNTAFSRFKDSLDFENTNASFTVFDYFDCKNQIDQYLIANKFQEQQITQESTGLFSESVVYSSTSYLIPERKRVDYFLKIEGEMDAHQLSNTLDKLNNIHEIITSYNIDPSTLKSKDYLIF
ncbi:hypothetical protein KH5_13000 [Urechidicola sp. KH5]